MSSTYPTPSPAISSTDLDKEREKDDRDLSENFPEQTPYLTSNTDKNTHHHHHNHHPTTTEFHSIHHTVSAPGVTLDLEKIESHRSHLSHKKSKQQHDVAEKPNPESDPNSDEFVRRYSGFRWFLVCIAMYVSAFLYGLDNTIVASIQSPILLTYGSSAIEKLGWLGIGFPLGSIASILFVGKCFATFDLKTVYIVSLLQFVGGSALCGAAPNMNAEIVGRVWAGLGAAGMYLGVLNVLAVNTSVRERSFYFGLCAGVWGLGCILGPIIGGSFASSSATWRWAFYINLLIFAVASPIIFFVLEPFNPDPSRTTLEKIRGLDWVGGILNAALYTCFVIGITFGGVEWAWSDGRVITFLVLFGVLVVVFAVQQTFSIFTTPQNRLFPIDFLHSRDLVLQFMAVCTSSTGLFIPIYYIPIYFAFTRGDEPIDAALRLLPFMCLSIFFFLLNGTLLPKTGGFYAPWILAGGIFMIAGGAPLYALLQVDSSNSLIYGLSVLAGIGTGLIGQSPYAIAQAKVPSHRIPDATGFINQAQIGAIALSLTITSAVFQNIGFKNIANVVQDSGNDYTVADIHVALAGAKSVIFETASEEVRQAVLAGIVDAISKGFILLTTAGAVATVAGLLMRWERVFGLEATAGG